MIFLKKSYVIKIIFIQIGGVTVTGGEPLLQAKFLIELFTKLKQEKILGSATITKIFKLLSLTDLVLLDVKHINDKKCKDLVGFSNQLELKFANYLSQQNIPIWIRQVLIPGITDDEQDLLVLKDFIQSLTTVQKVELLPYHAMGCYKWKQLGSTKRHKGSHSRRYQKSQKGFRHCLKPFFI